ncbi:polyphosphoinositide phosphatase [Nilaparvata lugens]|uniref:polyphosphoinositide phosphatase n=1 Tax=Nilaparvata lugens TaxID=108931 RepID=UPI00193CE7C2|nr:polyphosphoinositide phosphatase [Nilaparvata lugens]
MDNVHVIMHPIISSIQKIALYETKTKLCIIASNNTQSVFRVLNIDRMEPLELVVADDGVEYTQEQVWELVQTLDPGGRSRANTSRAVSAFGIVGFVRFLEGYYLIVVTKRRRVAVIGLHTIYKIEDTSMIYIPNESVRIPHPDEPRYLKMFQSIDLSSNFYFSYSYDITQTLQVNMSIPTNLDRYNGCFKSSSNASHVEDAENIDIFSESDNNSDCRKDKNNSGSTGAKQTKIKKIIEYAVQSIPNRRFVWNQHLLSKIENILRPDWILYIMHGFVSQSAVNIFGRNVYITLIARRSSKYAGTRFLKRGANFEGDVANEVETEQVVEDTGVSSYDSPRITSFVQMRGSIPAHWSQDISKMVPKPAIIFDLSDPYSETAGAHFNNLLYRYGSPIIILNLVKKREKKKHESQLSEEFSSSVRYLNKFLPVDHCIQYVSFDMARMNKGKEANVMGKLADIARNAIFKTGIYQSYNRPDGFAIGRSNNLQTGIIRVNCVDCLDRTNTAQFALGKCALGFQLHSLGVLGSPNLDFDSDCVRLLEVLYEDHGDTLALQYGGSQLVHRIRTYRKTAPWTSQGNDIMQTLSRYYSNTFSDAEKQHAMNLFLGLFIPEENQSPIWEMMTDYYLHHLLAVGKQTRRRYPYVSRFRDFMPHCVTDFSPFTVRVRPGRRREDTAKVMKNPSLTGQSSTSSTTSSASSSMESDDDDIESKCSDSYMSSPAKDANCYGNIVTFQSCFPSMKQTYGVDISNPGREETIMYKRYVITDRIVNHPVTSNISKLSKQEFKLTSQSSFMDDSSFEIKSPSVDEDSVSIYKDYCARSRGVLLDEKTKQSYERYEKCELGLFTCYAV